MKKFTLVLTIFAVLAIFSAERTYGQGSKAYTVEINGMNPSLANGEIFGEAILLIHDGQLTITLATKGLKPDMMHLQHIHGFVDGRKSTCPTSTADANGDGVVDLIETEPAAGTTLIPFNATPVDLQIKSDTYPTADSDGLITYHITVPLERLEESVRKEYDIDRLSLENRVIFIHGIPENDPLPNSAESLPGVPSHITVPVACGEIKAL